MHSYKLSLPKGYDINNSEPTETEMIEAFNKVQKHIKKNKTFACVTLRSQVTDKLKNKLKEANPDLMIDIINKQFFSEAERCYKSTLIVAFYAVDYDKAVKAANCLG